MLHPVRLSELPSDEVKMNSFKKPQLIYTVVKLPDLLVLLHTSTMQNGYTFPVTVEIQKQKHQQTCNEFRLQRLHNISHIMLDCIIFHT